MAQQLILLGAAPNDDTGDTPRDAGTKINANFTELYADKQPLDGTLTALAALTIAANSLILGTGADAFSVLSLGLNTFPARASTGAVLAKPITDFGLSLVDDANAGTARTTLGGTTVGQSLFTLANPGAITFPRLNADNTVTARSAADFRTDLGVGTADAVTFGDLTCSNLTASGTLTILNTTTLTVDDPLIRLADNNTAHVLDIGVYGGYQPAATPLYAGLFLDATDSKFKMFAGLEAEPTTTVNTAGAGYTAASLVIGGLEAATGAFTGVLTASAGSVGAPSIASAAQATDGVYFPAAGFVAVTAGGVQRFTVSGSRFLFEGTSSRSMAGATEHLQFDGTNGGIGSCRNSNDAAANIWAIGKSRGTAAGGVTALALSDVVGDLRFFGADGTDLSTHVGRIVVGVSASGTVATNRLPSYMDFYTHPDSVAAGATFAMRIDKDQAVLIGTTTNDGVSKLQLSGKGYISGELELDGALNHDGTTLGFRGLTPVVMPTAYTQTYSTAARTVAALTSATLTDNSAGTANTTIQAVPDPADAPITADGLREDIVANVMPALRNNFADLAAQVNALRADILNVKEVQNAQIDDRQADGLAQ